MNVRFGVFVIAVVGFLLVVTSQPYQESQRAFAEGSAADAMCNPVKMDCECGMVKNDKTGQCEMKGPQQNMHNCTCFDNTKGHVTTGKCVAPNKCHGEKCDGKECEQNKGEGMKPPEMPKPPEKKPPEQPKQQDQKPCSASTGSTGSRDSAAASGTSSNASSTAATSTPANSSDPCASSVSSFDPSSYTSAYDSTGSGSSYQNSYPFTNLLDDLSNGTVGSGSSKPSGVSVVNGGDQGSIQIVSMETSHGSTPGTSSGVPPTSGATGFSGGGYDDFNSDVIDVSLIGRASSLLSATGDSIGNAVVAVVNTVRGASGYRDETEKQQAPPQDRQQAQAPDTTREQEASDEKVDQAQDTATTTQAVRPAPPPAGGSPARTYGAPPSASGPSAPFAPPPAQSEGIVHTVLSGFFGGVQTIVTGIGDFARGFFGVFAK